MVAIKETPYVIEDAQVSMLQSIASRVEVMRSGGKLSAEVLGNLRKYFRIKSIYHSNAIEGNQLNIGETRTVVQLGLTITGKPLKDQAEAKNLSSAIDFLEELAASHERPITEADVRQIHLLVLKDINDDQAGRYRITPVEIGGSKYPPPKPEAVPGEMQTFGEWLQKASTPGTLFEQQEAILAASAAHTWFVTIHPFIDGNGRVGRLIMNLLLMRYGYPIVVVSREDRLRYYDALEYSQSSDLTPFAALIAECLDESLEEYEAAAKEQRERLEWAQSIAAKFDKNETVRASNSYEVWKSAMELLKSLFRQTTEYLAQNTTFGEIYFKDFGVLEFEKYISLKNYGSAKRTWFFRVDFKSGRRSARYLFFFGAPSFALRANSDVSLFVSREEPEGSYHYEKIDGIPAGNTPTVVEIGYKIENEAFMVRQKDGKMRTEKVEAICKKFVQEVIEKHFDSM